MSRVAAHFGISVKERRARWVPLVIALKQAKVFEQATGYQKRPDQENEAELEMEELDELEEAYRDVRAA